MRKWIFALILCMVLILSACRPAGENELPAGSEGGGETQQTEQSGTSEGETPDPQTPATDQTEEPETESPAIGETGTPVEDETGTPSETHECTYTEDPELRAQADAIDVKTNTMEYIKFCERYDIKGYLAIPGQFVPQTVEVTLRRACSDPNRNPPDFSCVQAIEVINDTENHLSYDTEHLHYLIKIPATTRNEVLEAIDKLMELDCVLFADVIPVGFAN